MSLATSMNTENLMKKKKEEPNSRTTPEDKTIIIHTHTHIK